MNIRVGFGFDVHTLREGRDFWLGGVKIASDFGAAGHSDADVLIHAICDALFGAAGLRDIGHHFPDSDAKWKDMQSAHFLKEAVRLVKEKGWRVGNVDSTVCLEAPKIGPHIAAMKSTLARILEITEDDISIKATTNERMGFIGRKEGVTAYAVVLVVK